ncbi:hypothetical protein [Aliiroseovarius sp. F47248L]|uniref:hypothetical protein n=1 Tax=Aliiroseovarius sp. F47248L TaxID=2926420 RepID=UPI001FF43F79|nr:hypothetical protein [Aliiroseovarius sp. F47248L]MCK0139063.1 hypothetical protein [Aliiroseovarius sp. F47248L]
MDDPVKRIANGAIDTDHYIRKAHEIRATETISKLAAIRRWATSSKHRRSDRYHRTYHPKKRFV